MFVSCLVGEKVRVKKRTRTLGNCMGKLEGQGKKCFFLIWELGIGDESRKVGQGRKGNVY